MKIYRMYGNGRNPIIFLHGLSQTQKAFDDQIELSDDYTVITTDLLGHGSNITEEHITLKKMAIDVLALMNALKLKQATICGVSLGGLVAQEIYHLAPERVKALILSNTYSYVPQVFLEMEIASRKDKLNSISDNEYIEGIARKCSLKQNDDVIDKIKHTIQLNRKTYIQCASVGIGKDYSGLARRVDKPVLICSGWFDLVTPYILQLQQHMMIPRSVHKQFWSGHLPNIECPKEFNQVVRDFMGGVN